MPPFRHLTQDVDPAVGPHFVVLIHRDIDLDPTSATRTDRQRMEIKIHTGAADDLEGHDFTRPKWRIYRSLNDKAALNAGEDSARFANSGITSGSDPPTSDCRGK